MLTMMLLAAAAVPCADPDDMTIQGRRMLERGHRCSVPRYVAPLLAAPAPLPPERRKAVIAFFETRLVDAAAARWKWPLQSKSTGAYCGWVDMKDKTGHSSGWTLYTVDFDRDGNVERGYIGTRMDAVFVKAVCGSNGYDIESPPVD